MKSRISWTRSERVAATSMKLRKQGSVLKPRRKNSRQHLRKLRQPLDRRRTKYSVDSLSSHRSDRRLTDVSRRRRKNLKTPGGTTSVQLILCKLHLKLKQRARLRHSG